MGTKLIAQNKKARHDYFIEDAYEAGIALTGTEVKSIRAGKMQLKDSYVNYHEGELFVIGMHISPYEHGNIFNVDPTRSRKLLLHRRQIDKIFGLMQRQGYTVVPLSCYLKNGLVKLEIAMARGKKLYDKRETDAKKTAQRDMQRAMRERNR